MFTIALVAACVVAWVLSTQLKERKERDFRCIVMKNTLEFLVPVILALLFYNVLLLYVSYGYSYTTMQTIFKIESGIAAVKRFFDDYLKLSPATWLLILIGVYLLSFIKSNAQSVYPFLDKYQLWFRRLYLLIGLLSAFTILGNNLGTISSDLDIHIKTTRAGYAVLRDGVKKVVAGQIAGKILPKTEVSLGRPYQSALDSQDQLDDRTVYLRTHYEQVKRSYGLDNPRADRLLPGYESQTDTSTQLERALADQSQPSGDAKGSDSDIKTDVPENVTPQGIDEATASIGRYRDRITAETVSFLKTESGRRISLQLPKLFTATLKKEVLSSVIKSRPILGPIIDTINTIVDEQVKSKLGGRIDDLTRSVTENPGSLEQTIESQAGEIAANLPVTPSAAEMRSAAGAVQDSQRSSQNVEMSIREIDTQVARIQDAEVSKLISNLHNGDEATRERAAKDLSKMGDNLSEGRVSELVRTMRTGRQRWAKFLYREGHCDYYEYTYAKYYAAEALNDMNSPYVNEPIKHEAANCRSNGRETVRITDPGWI